MGAGNTPDVSVVAWVLPVEGQVPVLIDETHARGWNDERIARRVWPYLS
jgi:hypothetical protein